MEVAGLSFFWKVTVTLNDWSKINSLLAKCVHGCKYVLCNSVVSSYSQFFVEAYKLILHSKKYCNHPRRLKYSLFLTSDMAVVSCADNACLSFWGFFPKRTTLAWTCISQVAFSNVFLSSAWHLYCFVPSYCCPQLLSAVAQLGWNSCETKQKWKRGENGELQVVGFAIWE